MKNLLTLFIALMSFNTLMAQAPDTEIFLIEVFDKDNKTTFGKPVNITNNDGYDNQPVFSPDGSKILYSSMRDTVQTDIYEYDIKTQKTKLVGKTTESEYSPAFIPGSSDISIVRVDLDKGQRVYKYSDNIAAATQIVNGLDSVAYYQWLNDTTMALVILNMGMDLYIYEMKSQQFVIAANQVGRCILKDPLTGNILFTMKSDNKTIFLSLDYAKFESDMFCDGLEDVEDYVFTSAAELLAGYEGKIYSMNPHGDKIWREIADLTKTVGYFYRISMSRNGKYMAVVTYRGSRP